MMVAVVGGAELYPAEYLKRGLASDSKSTEMACPQCGSPVYFRSESTDGKCAHFAHHPEYDNPDCTLRGESDEHKVMKSQVATRLRYITNESIVKEITIEKTLDSPVSEHDYRKADVYLEFTDEQDELGRGIVVEVQHKNANKNIDKTSADYNRQNLTVIWVNHQDFNQKRCLLESFEQLKKSAIAGEIQHYCPECGRRHAPDPVDDGEVMRSKTCRGCNEWFTVFEHPPFGFRSDRPNTVPLSELMPNE